MIQRYSFFFFLATMFAVGVQAEQVVDVEQGEASYYADSLHGNKTASGEPYDKNGMTAAHRTLPFGTPVKVTVIETGKSVKLVINDRGPHAKGRIIDVSGAAADKLGLRKAGHAPVKLEIYSK
jgi:rare lipoprotein A